jgi:D-alanyl-D-alanine carboxypeptidase
MSMPTGTVPADATAPRSRWRRITRAVARLLAMLALVCAVGTAGYVVYGALPGETRRATAASHTAEVLAQPLPPPPASTAREAPAVAEVEGDDGVLPPLDASAASHAPIKGAAARATLLLDADSGRVIWARHEHEQLPIASLTKLMTAVLAVRGGGLDDVIAVRKRWLGVGGSSVYLVPRQHITVRTLLYGLLMVSGNDAANVLAIHRAGSVRAFVGAMNAEARRLGLGDSHFASPSGLIDRDNHSTAWDVGDLARYLLGQPLLARIMRTRTLRAPHHVTWVNHNRLLFRYRGATGMKTGYTDMAGSCLVASATRGRRTLIAVVLHARGDEFRVAARMLDWGFGHSH